MANTPAIYLGKVVSKDNFRVFIYSADGSSKLVESWDEYQECMQTGVWFAEKSLNSNEEPAVKRLQEKPKRQKKKDIEAEIQESPLVFEVTE